MTPDNLPIIFGLVFAAFFVGSIAVAATRSRTDHIRLLGEDMGITVVGGEPVFKSAGWLSFLKKPTRLAGDYRGGRVELWHFSRSSGKSSTPYIGLRLYVDNPRGLSFQIYKEGVFSKIGKTFGMEDIEVGDPRFDKEFVVKCSDPGFIQAALLPEIKERCYEVFERHGARGTIKLRENEIYYEENGRLNRDARRGRFEALINLCADLRDTVYVYNQGP